MKQEVTHPGARTWLRCVAIGASLFLAPGAAAPGALTLSGVPVSDFRGSELVAYSLFDRPGKADSAASQTFFIAIEDDDDYKGAERFRVGLAPSGNRHADFPLNSARAVATAASDASGSDTALSGLVLASGGVNLPINFSAGTRRYDLGVPYETSYILVTPTARNGRASVEVAGVFVESGETSPEIALRPGVQVITVNVTAEDGSMDAYEIHVARADRTARVVVNADEFTLSCPSFISESSTPSCTLTNTDDSERDWPVVAVLHGEMDSERAYVAEDTTSAGDDFSRDVGLVKAQVPPADRYRYGYGEMFSGGSFSMRVVYGFQKFDWDGKAAAGEKRDVDLRVIDDGIGENVEVFYVAMAPSGYTGLSELVSNRVPVLVRNVNQRVSNDATLSALALSGIDIGFTSETTGYTANVAHAVAATSVTATTTHADANLVIMPPDTDEAAEGHQVSLEVGETVIEITVTAADGQAMETYTVTVSRAKSNDATLSALALSGIDIGFTSETTGYTANVAHEVAATSVTATTTHADANLVITPPDTNRAAEGHQVSLEVGETVIEITVTAADGQATETYTVTVSRAKSSDATLNALALSDIDIGFTSETTGYTANVAHEVAATSVTATATHADANLVITPPDTDEAAEGHQVSLEVGETVIKITVTAADGRAMESYTVTVSRAETPSLAWGERLPARDLPVGDVIATALWSNGETIWVAPWEGYEVIAYRLADGERLPEKDVKGLPALNPSGLWSNGKTLWVSDFDSSRIYAHRLSGGEPLPDQDLGMLINAGNGEPTGIWSNGETLWAADFYGRKLFAYRLSGKRREEGAEIVLNRSPKTKWIRPFGIWSDGRTLLVADWNNGRVVAYRLSGNEWLRLPARDIDTEAAGNRWPLGLWSDGEVLWVADEQDGKLYAYAVPGLNKAAGTR